MNVTRPALCKKGFSLVELLTVIAIIGILAGTIGYALIGGGGAVIPAAQRTLGSLVDAARSTALVRNSNAYLIIYNDPNGDPTKHLRFVGIVYNPLDANGVPQENRYIPVNDGVYLPNGVIFVPPGGANVDGTGDVYRSSNAMDESRAIEFPAGSGNNDNWIIYGFDKNGQTLSDSSQARAPALVIVPGSFTPGEDSATISDPYEARGIWVRPQGSVMMINDYQELADSGLVDVQ